VFVNPVAGRGRSTRIYREKVAPLFELARVATEVVVTEKRQHAQNVLQEIDLEQYDGLVSAASVVDLWTRLFLLHFSQWQFSRWTWLAGARRVTSSTCCR